MKRRNNVLGNLFSSSLIIPGRLGEFGLAVQKNLSALPDSATYADVIEAIGAALDDMQKEGGDVDVNLIVQKDDTSSVQTFIDNFIAFMDDNEMNIGAALGGKKSAGYKAYYPFGKSEYGQITHKAMAEVTLRLQMVTTTYGSKLPKEIADTLNGFKDGWDAVRGKQKQQMGAVQIDRTQHSAAYAKLQLVLTKAVHKFGYENPGNDVLGSKVFPFSMLYAPSRNHTVKLTGALEAGATQTLMNRRMTARVSFLVQNTSVNADLCLWTSPVADGAAPVNAFILPAGATKKVSRNRLGDLSGTFLRVQNMSAVNTGDYEITVSGLPKDKKAPASKKSKKEAPAADMHIEAEADKQKADNSAGEQDAV